MDLHEWCDLAHVDTGPRTGLDEMASLLTQLVTAPKAVGTIELAALALPHDPTTSSWLVAIARKGLLRSIGGSSVRGTFRVPIAPVLGSNVTRARIRGKTEKTVEPRTGTPTTAIRSAFGQRPSGRPVRPDRRRARTPLGPHRRGGRARPLAVVSMASVEHQIPSPRSANVVDGRAQMEDRADTPVQAPDPDGVTLTELVEHPIELRSHSRHPQGSIVAVGRDLGLDVAKSQCCDLLNGWRRRRR